MQKITSENDLIVGELKPCPFCKGTNTLVKRNTLWTGMGASLISAEVQHWCEKTLSPLQSYLSLKAKTEEEAIMLWNTRTPSPDNLRRSKKQNSLRYWEVGDANEY